MQYGDYPSDDIRMAAYRTLQNEPNHQITMEERQMILEKRRNQLVKANAKGKGKMPGLHTR